MQTEDINNLTPFDEVAAYAAQHAETDADLDKELEQAAIEQLLTLEEYEQ